MSNRSVYSPLPATSYALKCVDDCEVSWILRQPLAQPIWNLFWLSNRNIDVVPILGNDWWTKYRVIEGAIAAVVADVADDEIMYRKLLMPSHRFAEWFERANHCSYRCYSVFGRELWVENVLSRSRERGQVITSIDNVTHVNFARRTA